MRNELPQARLRPLRDRFIIDDEELATIADLGDYTPFFCAGCHQVTPHKVLGNTAAPSSSKRSKR